MTTYPMKLTCTKCGAVDEGTLHIEDSKPLTDEEIENIQFATKGDNHIDRARNFARAIEAAHGIYAPTELKEKNT